ncbi:transposase [Candidatus Acetothermia bacterium]|jgi:putative transposase|nr:transposase [Candidatus Acetothermia bacterium]MCI2430982.1 transposase [Candidatus Acetothermia bacterium]MCI2436351.1 transposase [Candidatus Acetothermia bacterium]
MKRAYQYRIYPTTKQEQALAQLLDVGRRLYNAALEHRLLCWKRYFHSVSYTDQAADLKRMRREDVELGQLNFSACQQVLRRLDKNYRAFLQGIRKRPRFKATDRFRSLEFRFGDGSGLTATRRLRVQNVGVIRVRWHRVLPEQAEIKDVVITRQANGKWFATFRISVPDVTPPVHHGPMVGLDVGLNHIVALSDGAKIKAPRLYRQAEERLTEVQQRYSLHRSRKQRRILTRLHSKVARQRKDFLHKLSRRLVDTYSLIVIESLNIKGMTHETKPGMSKSIHDAGWATLAKMLDYKAANAGSEIRRVDAPHTSQLCSACWCYVPKTLHIREHHCPSCGLVLDRDVNAARVILVRALGWDAAFGPRAEKHPALVG